MYIKYLAQNVNTIASSLCGDKYAQKLIVVIFSALYKIFDPNNLGEMIEFRLLVGIGRSGVMIGRLCLNMVS